MDVCFIRPEEAQALLSNEGNEKYPPFSFNTDVSDSYDLDY